MDPKEVSSLKTPLNEMHAMLVPTMGCMQIYE
jgi:hypothetical protein